MTIILDQGVFVGSAACCVRLPLFIYFKWPTVKGRIQPQLLYINYLFFS